jgi:4-amino-4-deoxy-L-arabinose transferase-like glycosyltransferase
MRDKLTRPLQGWAAPGSRLLTWRLVALALAGGLAISVLLERRLLSSPESQWALSFALLAALGIAIAVALRLATTPAASTPIRASSGSGVWTPPLLAIAALSLVGSLWSATLLPGNDWAAQWLWLATMALPVLALVTQKVARRRKSSRERLPARWSEGAVILALFAGSLALRLPLLTSVPPFVHGDEATCGLMARSFLNGAISLLQLPQWGLPTFGFAINGVGMRFFGDNLLGLRFTNCLVGSIGVVLTYLLGKEWFGRRAALLAALLLALSFLDNDLSRDGIHYIQGPTFITLSLYLLTLWLTRGSSLAALFAGLSIPLNLQVYFSARAVIAPTAVMGAYMLVQRWTAVRDRWQEILWFALGLFVAAVPVVALFATQPTSFNEHQSSVSIFSRSADMAAHLRSEYGTSALTTVLRGQIWRTITTFNVRGDSSLQIAWRGPMLDWLTSALLIAAIVLALLRWRQWTYAACLTWFLAVVGAVAITIDPPWWPRLAAVLPAAMLLVGAFLDAVWAVFERAFPQRRVDVVLSGVLLAAIAILNLQTIFDDYPSLMRQTGNMGPTLVGQFLAGRKAASRTALISDGSFLLSHETIRFLAPKAAGCTILPHQPWSSCPNLARTRLFVVLPGALKALTRLQRTYPQGKKVQVGTYFNGAATVVAFEP